MPMADSSATIKVRSKTTGKLYSVPEASFVEVCTPDDKVAVLVAVLADGADIRIAYPGDALFASYMQSFKRGSSKKGVIKWNDRKRAYYAESS